MSKINLRTLLSKTVSAIKEKLGVDSFTWAQFETKLSEAMNGADAFSKAVFEDGSVSFGKTEGDGRDLNIVVPNGISKIGLGIFYKNARLKTIVIPQSVETIEKNAFNESCRNYIKQRR